MSGGGVLGASASDAVTDALLEEGERPAGRSEWEDALIKHRIIEAPPPPPPSADDDLLAAADSRAPHAKGEAALAQLSVDELDELEDDPDVDERALQTYRYTAPHCTTASLHHCTTPLHCTALPPPLCAVVSLRLVSHRPPVCRLLSPPSVLWL